MVSVNCPFFFGDLGRPPLFLTFVCGESGISDGSYFTAGATFAASSSAFFIVSGEKNPVAAGTLMDSFFAIMPPSREKNNSIIMVL